MQDGTGTHMLGGDDFAACAAPRGLRLPRCAEEPDVVRCAVGEDADTAATAAAAADSSAVDAVVFDEDLAPLFEELLPKDGLSWGAGDGAMVMAVLIVRVRGVDETIAKLQKGDKREKNKTREKTGSTQIVLSSKGWATLSWRRLIWECSSAVAGPVRKQDKMAACLNLYF